jgi:hypothetical protein
MAGRKYDASTIPICLPHEKREETKICKKCNITYCPCFASKVDIRFCANCMGDFKVRNTIVEKEVEYLKPDGTVYFQRKYQAMAIKLEGTDWLFTAENLLNLSDEDIEATIEYHKANYSIMLMERENRKTERMNKLASQKILPPNRLSQHEREKKEAAANKPKTSRVKSMKNVSPEDLLKVLLGSMSPEQIAAALGGKK